MKPAGRLPALTQPLVPAGPEPRRLGAAVLVALLTAWESGLAPAVLAAPLAA